MPNKNIVVAGHVCLDITPVFSNNRKLPLESVLVPGKLIEMKGVSVNAGGAVSNTGLGLKVLGANVELMGKVGDDAFGSLILDLFQKYDAHHGMIIDKGSNSSYSVVIAPPGTDRIFLHDSGANDTFCYADLDFEKISKASHFHFGYPPIMKNMYINDGEELVRIFKKVKELGLTTSLDMAGVDPESEAGRCDWLNILQRVLPYVDFFVPSIEELGYMLDKAAYADWMKRAAGSDVTKILSVNQDIKPLANKLIELGAKVVLIKCGAPGMFLKTADQEVVSTIKNDFECWANLEVFEDSYVPDQILSATGAGDTSIAAFLKAIIDGYEPSRCLQLATATGASCVTAYDALSGLKPFEELNTKIDAGWEKQKLANR